MTDAEFDAWYDRQKINAAWKAELAKLDKVQIQAPSQRSTRNGWNDQYSIKRKYAAERDYIDDHNRRMIGIQHRRARPGRKPHRYMMDGKSWTLAALADQFGVKAQTFYAYVYHHGFEVAVEYYKRKQVPGGASELPA